MPGPSYLDRDFVALGRLRARMGGPVGQSSGEWDRGTWVGTVYCANSASGGEVSVCVKLYRLCTLALTIAVGLHLHRRCACVDLRLGSDVSVVCSPALSKLAGLQQLDSL